MQLHWPRLVRDNISTGIPFQMADIAPTVEAPISPTIGHLSVHIEGEHPAEVPFLFEQQQKRVAPAAAASLVTHLVMAVVMFVLIRYAPRPVTAAAMLPEKTFDHIVWLTEPGPGGGGGGGGNQIKEPPRATELPGKDKITVPVEKPKKLEVQQQVKNEPNPIEQLNIPAKSSAAALESLPGAIEAPPGPPSISQGSGTGGGAGTGSGTGIGSGRGSGLGEGYGGGTGGGAYRPGNGVTLPTPISQPRPNYTSDAMRAKIQGTVLLECVVNPDGSVSNIEVIRSLDPTFGLDGQAIEAARRWKFKPGTRFGQPVPVLVSIELTFTLR